MDCIKFRGAEPIDFMVKKREDINMLDFDKQDVDLFDSVFIDSAKKGIYKSGLYFYEVFLPKPIHPKSHCVLPVKSLFDSEEFIAVPLGVSANDNKKLFSLFDYKKYGKKLFVYNSVLIFNSNEYNGFIRKNKR